jgi:hypothetical protein
MVPPSHSPTEIEKRNTGMLRPCPARRMAELATGSWLLVALALVAVAQRRLGPSSSTKTSTVGPGGAVLGRPCPLLEAADESSASAHGESHLTRTA